MATTRKAPADQTIEMICHVMAGAPYDAQLANRIADILASAGHKIPELESKFPCAKCPGCQRTDEIAIRESYIVLHPYDAVRHEAELEEPDPEDGEADYTGYCSACGMKGSLASFGIPEGFSWSEGGE